MSTTSSSTPLPHSASSASLNINSRLRQRKLSSTLSNASSSNTNTNTTSSSSPIKRKLFSNANKGLLRRGLDVGRRGRRGRGRRRFGRIIKRTDTRRNSVSNKKVIRSDDENDEESQDEDELDEENEEEVAKNLRVNNLEYVNTNSSNNIKLNDDDSATSISEEGTCTTFLTSMGEDVFITDITSGVVTVTIKECVSPEGFFKKRLLENDL